MPILAYLPNGDCETVRFGRMLFFGQVLRSQAGELYQNPRPSIPSAGGVPIGIRLRTLRPLPVLFCLGDKGPADHFGNEDAGREATR